jgi:hypothetical protein
MAHCYRCGAETRLYSNGTPVCMACVNVSEADQKDQPKPQQPNHQPSQ